MDFKFVIFLHAAGKNHADCPECTAVDPGQGNVICLNEVITTVHWSLYCCRMGCRNSFWHLFQAFAGEDVISRIIYAEKPKGLEKMHDLVIGAMNESIDRMLKGSLTP